MIHGIFAPLAAALILFGGHDKSLQVHCKLRNGDVIQTNLTTCLKKHGDVVKPKRNDTLVIKKVITHPCTFGSSCYGWQTTVEVKGEHFTDETRVKLVGSGIKYEGIVADLNGKSKIVTDFIGLPHCQTFDVIAFNPGPTGKKDVKPNAVSSVCP
jgi:hypothetical protein